MDNCDKCGGKLRAGEAGVCKSCRQTQKEAANVQALAATRAAELAPPKPPDAPKKIATAPITKKEAAPRRPTFRRPNA